MAELFPRTRIGGLSIPRLVIGTNWFLAYSHTSESRDQYIRDHMSDRKVLADILEVFLRHGVDTLMGDSSVPFLKDAMKEAEDRTGKGMITIATPTIPVGSQTPVRGFKKTEVGQVLDAVVKKYHQARICMPHATTTDSLVEKCNRTIRHMGFLCKMIRERGMIPGLSTHMPESIVYADETGLDVETYIAIYNSMGFLMHLEVDWIHRIISEAKKPVLAIKPLAAGQLHPFQALNFVWNTLRDKDMVVLSVLSPQEAEEDIRLSLDILNKRKPTVKLQETRSKTSVRPAKKR